MHGRGRVGRTSRLEVVEALARKYPPEAVEHFTGIAAESVANHAEGLDVLRAAVEPFTPERVERVARVPTGCGVLELDGTTFVWVAQEEPGAFECDPLYAAKVTGPLVDAANLDQSRISQLG